MSTRKPQRNLGIRIGGLVGNKQTPLVQERLWLCTDGPALLGHLSEYSCQTLGSDDIKGHCLWSTEEMIVVFRDQLQNLFGSLLVTAEFIGLK